MKEKLPLTTLNEIRSCFWPASKFTHATGFHSQESLKRACAPTKILFDDKSFVVVAGPRCETHRRTLDYIFSKSRMVPLDGDDSAFFFDIKDAARVVLGRRSYSSRMVELVTSLRKISLDYYDAGGKRIDGNVPREGAVLLTKYITEFQAGENVFLDKLTQCRGISLLEVEGLFMVRISGVYMRHISRHMTFSYHPALPKIFQMGPVAASLARLILTHKFQNSKSLNSLLGDIGCATGSARDIAVRKIRNGKDIVLLSELGIKISESGNRRELVVNYTSSANETLAITQSAVKPLSEQN